MSLEIRKLIQAIGGGAGVQAQVIAMLDSVGGSLWVADPQYLALNSDGTGAVTVGGAVGYMRDLCAAARHMTQATTAAKPLINQVSGKWALQFDGVNDYLGKTDAVVDTTGSTTFIAAYNSSKVGGWGHVLSAGTGSTSSSLSRMGVTTAGVGVCGFKDAAGVGPFFQTAASVIGSAKVVSATHEKTASRATMFIDSVSAGTSTTASAASPSTGLYVGALPNGSESFGGSLYAAIYTPVLLTTEQQLMCERYLASLCGVTIP